METTRDDVKEQFCRGQVPEEVTPAEYNALPPRAQIYITNNVAQFNKAGCKPT